MRTALTITAGTANQAPAILGTKNAEMGTIQRAVLNVINELAPRKPWAFIASTLRMEDRTAKHRAVGTRQFSAEEIGALLQSEDGFRFLAAIMSAAPNLPLWFRICAPLMELADVQRMQLAARRKYEATLRKAVNADDQLAETIQRGQTALMVQDADFYGAHVAPTRELASSVGAVGRSHNRPMAQKRGR